MALWLVRVGKHGEHEKHFLETNRIYICWDELKHDLGKLKSKDELRSVLEEHFQDATKGHIRNNLGQLWPFAHEMKSGDWVVVPSKIQPSINIAEITGQYVFDPKANDPYYHYRNVKWIARDVPRSVFDQDLLYSFGAFMTICQIERNDAENRVRQLAASGWKAIISPNLGSTTEGAQPIDNALRDLERLSNDQIARWIRQRFKGHRLTALVESILIAQGYHTYCSPPGPDKGVDILAAPGSLGFGQPRICVQVKSGDEQVDRPTLDQLIGTMQNVKAEQGLLVSLGGFKSSIDREIPAQFFQVRLWNADDLIRELLANYDKLDEDIRADIPLKRIWALAAQEDENDD